MGWYKAGLESQARIKELRGESSTYERYMLADAESNPDGVVNAGRAYLGLLMTLMFPAIMGVGEGFYLIASFCTFLLHFVIGFGGWLCAVPALYFFNLAYGFMQAGDRPYYTLYIGSGLTALMLYVVYYRFKHRNTLLHDIFDLYRLMREETDAGSTADKQSTKWSDTLKKLGAVLFIAPMAISGIFLSGDVENAPDSIKFSLVLMFGFGILLYILGKSLSGISGVVQGSSKKEN
jgi:hypothetical protein